MSYHIPEAGERLSGNIDDYPDGIVLPIDKPYRWTSADVIRKVKWAACHHFGKKNLKVGHAGTLDPLATGVLLVCIGKATKLADRLQAHEKEYVAGVSFGATTASFDLEKEIDADCPLEGVSEESVRAMLPAFVGKQMQVAPLFSAKSVDGVRAYETARKLYKEGRLCEGNDILTASEINISGLDLLSFEPAAEMASAPAVQENDRNARINVADIGGHTLVQTRILVRCSKGTYIRALARDFGEALGSGAFLHSLRRTATGEFRVDSALSLEEAMRCLDKN